MPTEVQTSSSRPDAMSPDGPRTDPAVSRGSAVLRFLSPSRIGAIYFWLFVIVLMTVLDGSRFFSTNTAHAIGNDYAISALAALAVLVPISTGVFDVSVGATIGLSAVVTAKLAVEQSLSPFVAAGAGILVGGLVGLVNAIVVVGLKIHSLIGTLAVMGMVGAVAVGFSGNRTIVGAELGGDFGDVFYRLKVFGFTRPFVYVLILMIILGIIMERTVVGKSWYATGYNEDAARVAGLRTGLLKTMALVLGGAISGFAGVVLTARLSSAAPGIGDSYLLPAFAAVFLGATQFRNMRFNPWGTIVAVFMLGTGAYGLILLGAPSWSGQIFQGVALIGAIWLTQATSKSAGSNVIGGM